MRAQLFRFTFAAALVLGIARAEAIDDPWVKWTADFNAAITACGNGEWCIEKAFSATTLPPPELLLDDPRNGKDTPVPYAVGNLIRDMRAGNIMLNIPTARYQLQDYYEIAGGVSRHRLFGAGHGSQLSGRIAARVPRTQSLRPEGGGRELHGA
jgi:hypothetical protein